MNEKIFRAICAQLGLGTITEPPRRLTGGFMHRMYSLFTDRGRYAVKLLNPHIMARPDAMDNFRRAEAIEHQLEQAGLPILAALVFNGRKMQEINGQYFYVFDWFDGHALRSDEVREEHCRIIGGILARIHAIGHREEQPEREPIEIDWNGFADLLLERNPPLGELVARSAALLLEQEKLANSALARLSPTASICHNDMDCKNVLWNGSECRIIDLECLGWSHPHLELYETAVCWSGIEESVIDARRFDAFIQAYQEAGGMLPEHWLTVHDSNAGRLEWLEYNLNRALGRNCSAEEVPLGESEVRKTIAQLNRYGQLRQKWE